VCPRRRYRLSDMYYQRQWRGGWSRTRLREIIYLSQFLSFFCPSTMVADALHRQIGISHVKPLLFRKKRQRCREGSRHASASHGTRAKPQTGTQAHLAAVPIQSPRSIAPTVGKLCVPRIWRQQQRPRPATTMLVNVGEVERGRSLCAAWASLVSVTMMAASGRAETDVLVMLYMLIVAWTPCAHS
jgi:hypothetical protein